jgi:hypothetical protein
MLIAVLLVEGKGFRIKERIQRLEVRYASSKEADRLRLSDRQLAHEGF